MSTDRIPVQCPNCEQYRTLQRGDANRAERAGTWCKPCCGRVHAAALIEAQAYVDEMAVERLITGSRVNSTRAERQAAVMALTARQVGAAVIAQRLRVSRRTVERLRARERVSA